MKHSDNFNKEELDLSGNWMLTYSDMVTIVLCFFIIFFVTSANENSVLYEIKEKLDGKLNVLETEKEQLMNDKEQLEDDYEDLTKKNQMLKNKNISLAEELFQLKNIVEDVNTSNEEFIEYLRENGLLEDVYLVQNDEGLLIRFKDSILFDSGEADLKGQANIILEKIADKVKDIDNRIRIEGFTDDKPIETLRFPSNWELSASRAISVVRYFVEEEGMNPDRFSFTGWGEYKPISSNDTKQGRNKNRRIEITILNKPN